MTVNRYEQDLFTLQAEEGKALAELEMLIGRELVDSNASQRAMMTRSNAVGSAR
jgi:hypothetical protein